MQIKFEMDLSNEDILEQMSKQIEFLPIPTAADRYKFNISLTGCFIQTVNYGENGEPESIVLSVDDVKKTEFVGG